MQQCIGLLCSWFGMVVIVLGGGNGWYVGGVVGLDVVQVVVYILVIFGVQFQVFGSFQ